MQFDELFGVCFQELKVNDRLGLDKNIPSSVVHDTKDTIFNFLG